MEKLETIIIMITTLTFSNVLWRKSSRTGSGGNCVEVATVNGLTGVRDSKNPSQAVLMSSSCQWESFIQGIKRGKFDL
jgi:predicted secreted Zn-dependent protease